MTYMAAQGNVGSLTYRAVPGIEPASSWILVGFITAEPQQEVRSLMFLVPSHKGLLQFARGSLWLKTHPIFLFLWAAGKLTAKLMVSFGRIPRFSDSASSHAPSFSSFMTWFLSNLFLVLLSMLPFPSGVISDNLNLPEIQFSPL